MDLRKNLKSIGNQIYLDSETEMAKKFPQSVLDWQGLSEKIDEQKRNVETRTCPKNVTDAEYDGVISVVLQDPEPISARLIEYYRLEALEKCPRPVPTPSPSPIDGNTLIMTAATCDCYQIELLVESTSIQMTPTKWKGIDKHSCKKLRTYYRCSEIAQVDEIADDLACPIRCFK